MKKLFCLMLFVAGSCHAEYLRLTEVIPGMNLFVFNSQYVVKITETMPDLPLGSLLEFNLDDFYSKDSWIQSFDIREGFNIDKYEVKYTAVGLFEKGVKGTDLEGLFQLIQSKETVGPLERISTYELQDNWFKKNHSFVLDTFSVKDPVERKTIDWVFKDYQRYTPSFVHSIRAIFDKNDNDLIVGILNHALKRKFYSHDHKYTLALFHKS